MANPVGLGGLLISVLGCFHSPKFNIVRPFPSSRLPAINDPKVPISVHLLVAEIGS